MAAPEIQAVADLLDDEMSVLLHVDAAAAPLTLHGRDRLLGRIARSAAATRRMHTRRHAGLEPATLAYGVVARELYRAARPALRPGEPLRSRLVELAPGACWAAAAAGLQREWLVLQGEVRVGTQQLQGQDFLLEPAAVAPTAVASASGALLLLREAPPQPGAQTQLQRAADAPWSPYGPGIERRVMAQHEGLAAMLYRTEPGAAVPHHGHHHDEECLMLAGDLFLDEVLLRPLDYQLAPAGTEHGGVFTDTGVLLYAHGDLDLDLRA